MIAYAYSVNGFCTLCVILDSKYYYSYFIYYLFILPILFIYAFIVFLSIFLLPQKNEDL